MGTFALIRSLARLLGVTLVLGAGGAAVGLLLFYLLETPPYYQADSLDPESTPTDIILDLLKARDLPSVRSLAGGDQSDIDGPEPTSRYSVMRFRTRWGAVAAAGAQMPEDHNLSRVVVSWITLQKFSSPLDARIAWLRMAYAFRNSNPIVNPIKGFFYTTPDVPPGNDSKDPVGSSPAFTTSAELRWTRFVWVDGVWVGFIQVPDERYASGMLEHFPYLDVTEGQGLLQGIDGKLVFPITGLAASLAFWPVVASRIIALRPDRTLRTAPADELGDILLSLNREGRRWNIRSANGTDFVAEWKLDDRTWQALFGKHGLSGARGIRLRVDRRRRVIRAADYGYRVRMRGKWGIDSQVSIGLRPVVGLDLSNWRYAANGAANAAAIKDPVLAAGLGYEVSAIKSQVVKTILGAGWSYQPVVFMNWS